MLAVADQHSCSPSLHVLGVWLVERADELAVWLGQLWLRLADLAHSSVGFYVPLPSVVGNQLGRRVVMPRVAE